MCNNNTEMIAKNEYDSTQIEGDASSMILTHVRAIDRHHAINVHTAHLGLVERQTAVLVSQRLLLLFILGLELD